MEGGRRVRFEVRINGTGWAFIPDYISEDATENYLNDMRAVYAGNKVWDATTEVFNIRPED